jgi:hypothetical protein
MKIWKLDLAKQVKLGCQEEDMVGLIFNTIGVRYLMDLVFPFFLSNRVSHNNSDAITMGTDGRLYTSLFDNKLHPLIQSWRNALLVSRAHYSHIIITCLIPFNIVCLAAKSLRILSSRYDQFSTIV